MKMIFSDGYMFDLDTRILWPVQAVGTVNAASGNWEFDNGWTISAETNTLMEDDGNPHQFLMSDNSSTVVPDQGPPNLGIDPNVVYGPSQAPKKDNALLYAGLALLAFLLMKQR